MPGLVAGCSGGRDRRFVGNCRGAPFRDGNFFVLAISPTSDQPKRTQPAALTWARPLGLVANVIWFSAGGLVAAIAMSPNRRACS